MNKKRDHWSDQPCPECKKAIAANARKCPYCQHEFSEAELAERKNTKYGAIGCAIILILGLVASIAMCSGDDTDPITAATEPASAEISEAVSAFEADLANAMGSCDVRAARLGEGVTDGSIDEYEGYQLATETYNVCMNVQQELRSQAIPGNFEGDVERAAEQARSECASAMTAKAMMAETIGEIMDGDTSPSKMTELSEDGDYVQHSMSQCSTAMIQISMAAGVGLKP